MTQKKSELVATWSDRIRASLARSVEAIVATGQLLLEAKLELSHGQWLETLEVAGISPRVAQMFISVAENPALSNTSNYSHLLPAAYNTLYVLSRVEPEERLIEALETGEVNPTTTLSEARAMAKAHGITKTKSPKLPKGIFTTVVADPPWQYENEATRGSASSHYQTMSMDELCALKIPAADDSHLWLWVTNPFLQHGFELLDAWGFEYKTTLTWVKNQIGLGNYLRSATEHVLFATRGSLPIERRDVPTYFVADRQKHSEKPDEFYEIARTCSPGPRLEMFARRKRTGFKAWGLEAEV